VRARSDSGGTVATGHPLRRRQRCVPSASLGAGAQIPRGLRGRGLSHAWARAGQAGSGSGGAGGGALVLADQRMPGMAGLDLLARARARHRAARRMLLVDLGDSAVGQLIVRAMTLGQLDGYLIKPTSSPVSTWSGGTAVPARGQWPGVRCRWRRASPASSRSGTSGTDRSSAWPPRSVRARR
jgi:CheY-like chemotaxis protein